METRAQRTSRAASAGRASGAHAAGAGHHARADAARTPRGVLAVLASLAALLLFALVPASAFAAERYGVIVFVEDYKNTANVEFAEEDAALARDVFENVFKIPAPNIRTVRNPTQGELTRLFGKPGIAPQIANKIRSNDAELFVYFAGHGAPAADPVTGGSVNYILASDSDPQALGALDYPYARLTDQLAAIRRERFPQGRVYLFLESCFSGRDGKGEELVTGVSATLAAPAPLAPPDEGLTVFAASAADQVAYWDPDRQNSVFTYALADALSASADEKGDRDGALTLGELRSALSDIVPARVSAIAAGKVQYPQVEGGEGDLVLASADPAGRLPVAERIDRDRSNCVLQLLVAIKRPVDELNYEEIVAKNTELGRLEYECGAALSSPLVTERGFLDYRNRIASTVSDCARQHDFLSQGVRNANADFIDVALETMQCTAFDAAAAQCLATGDFASAECGTLADASLAWQVEAVDPVCEPSFAEAVQTARREVSLDPIGTFVREHPQCPQTLEEASLAEDQLCAELSASAISGRDERLLEDFVAGMQGCRQYGDVEDRMAELACESAWRAIDRRDVSDESLAGFLDDNRQCEQYQLALDEMDRRVGDLIESADEAVRRRDTSRAETVIASLGDARERFDVWLRRERMRDIDDRREALSDLVDYPARCRAEGERAAISNDADAMRAFLSDHEAKCDARVVASVKGALDDLTKLDTCREAYAPVAGANEPRPLYDFIDRNVPCKAEIAAAEARLSRMAERCLSTALLSESVGQLRACGERYPRNSDFVLQVRKEIASLESPINPVPVPPRPDPTPPGPAWTAYVDVNSALNMRSAASTSASVITSIPRNGTVSVSGCSSRNEGRWCSVEYQGLRGFVAEQFLSRTPLRTVAKPRPTPPAPTPPSGGGGGFLYGTDLYGGDLPGMPIGGISLGACQTACVNNGACQAFTYNQRNSACFLKSSTGRRESHNDAVSGIVRTGTTRRSSSPGTTRRSSSPGYTAPTPPRTTTPTRRRSSSGGTRRQSTPGRRSDLRGIAPAIPGAKAVSSPRLATIGAPTPLGSVATGDGTATREFAG